MADRLTSMLNVILPTEAQWSLLRACLFEGEPGRVAWAEWEKRHGGVTAVLAGGMDGVKRLLPMLCRAQRRNGIEVDPVVATCLRTAHMREEFRANTYQSIANRALKTLREAEVDFIVLKGAALAETVYDEPGERHCHDVDLLVPTGQMDNAVNALLERTTAEGARDFRLFHRTTARGAERASIVHETGLPILLHQNLFRIPYYHPPLEAMRSRAVAHDIAEVPVRVLAPSDALIHVIGHAASSPVRSNAVWVCDAWMILEKNPDLDWSHFRSTILESRLTLPVLTVLTALREFLDARIPETILQDLQSAAARVSIAETEAAVFAAASGPGGRLGDLRPRASSFRERLALFKWMFLPSMDNTQAFYRIESRGAVLPFVLVRPFRAVLWRLFRRSWIAGPPEQVMPDFMTHQADAQRGAATG